VSRAFWVGPNLSLVRSIPQLPVWKFETVCHCYCNRYRRQCATQCNE